MIVKEILTSHKQGFYKPGKQKDGNVHFVRISDINNDFYLDVDSTPMIAADESDIARFTIKKDDFLFARTGGAGRFCLINEDLHGIFASYLIRFRFNKQNDSHFLRYFFMSDSFQKELKSKIHGGVNQNVHAENIKDCSVPKFKLTQQKQIVTIIDKAFAVIDTAKANAEQNLINAKELFESYLQNVFENKGDDWESCELNDFVNFIDYRGRTPVKTDSGVRLITAKNIKLGHLQVKPEEFIAEDNYESWMTRGIPNFGDIIFTTEAPLAHIAQVNTDEKLAFAQRVIVMQPEPLKINQTFLKYLLLSNPIRNKILAQGTGATVLGIKSRLLKKIRISFPKSIKGQEKIVKTLDNLSAETKKLEAIYTQKIADLEEMKKSILQTAFSGELKVVIK